MGLFDFLKKEKKESKKIEKKENRKEINLHFYASKKNDDNILKELVNIFGSQVEGAYQINGLELNKESKDFMIKLDNGSLITGTLDNSEEAQDQSVGMYNYFSAVKLENENLKNNILKQISLFNCMINLKFAYNDDETNSKKIEEQLKLLHNGIEHCGGFIFNDLDNIFHPNGKLLISKDGNSEFTNFMPVVYGDFK